MPKTSKLTVTRKTLRDRIQLSWPGLAVGRVAIRSYKRSQNFLRRRPHRSFRRTRGRDMPAVQPLPGSIFFTSEVMAVIKRFRRPYIYFLLIYTFLFTAIAGILDQASYTSFSETIKNLAPSVIGGDVNQLTQAGTTFAALISTQLSEGIDQTTQVYLTVLALFTWLSVVWFLRQRLNGSIVNVRDAIYNSGAPVLSTFLVGLVGLFQLLPAAIAIIAFWTASQVGVIVGGVEAMLFAVAMILLIILSLYWVTSTLLAMVVVTLPGTYPFRALSIAGDIIVGRRLTMLYRLVWLIFLLVLLWVFILIPTILLADALPWKWLPLVPFVAQMLAGASLLFAATYIYLLYRRMIDAGETAKPKKRRTK